MDFSVGDIPIDIIIFSLIAIFLILRLRSVLGKKTGFEKHEAIALTVKAPAFLSNTKNKPVQPAVAPVPKVNYEIPAANSELGQTLQKISALDSTFVPQKFVAGTEIVFRKILTAFANADLNSLGSMLTSDAYSSFERAIKKRQEAHEIQKIEIKAICSIAITKAEIKSEVDPKKALIEVKIISDQLNCIFDKKKEPVVGTESVTEFIDFWLFERVLGMNGQDISWRLKSTRTGT